MKHLFALVPITIAAALAACATPPDAPASPAEAVGCSQLDAQIAQAEASHRAATDKEQNAWKAVVPFAVAARYATGKAAAGEAEQQLGTLQAESARQGCVRHGQ